MQPTRVANFLFPSLFVLGQIPEHGSEKQGWKGWGEGGGVVKNKEGRVGVGGGGVGWGGGRGGREGREGGGGEEADKKQGTMEQVQIQE